MFDHLLVRSKHVLGLGALIAVVGAAGSGCDRPVATAEAVGTVEAVGTGEAVASDHQALVERGEYLVMVGGCNDCHTPWIMGPNGPEPDMTRMLSGHPQDLEVGAQIAVPAEAGIWIWAPHNTSWVSPAGIAYAFNLTPDENTGIGIWTEEMFIKTLRTGKHWGVARDILPPMPWFNYGKMTDEDLKAVWAYLRTIPPVHNRVPDAVVAPPPPVVVAGAS